MTAQEFIEKHPLVSEVNSGLLENMACPDCGNRSSFRIAFAGTAEVDDESSSDDGDHEWDKNSHCSCGCGRSGTVADFTIEGLEEAIAA